MALALLTLLLALAPVLSERAPVSVSEGPTPGTNRYISSSLLLPLALLLALALVQALALARQWPKNHQNPWIFTHFVANAGNE